MNTLLKTFSVYLLLIFSISTWALSAQEITASQALKSYINNDDKSFVWQCKDSLIKEDLTAYRLRMKSQTWRGIEWIHELIVFVPQYIENKEALIHISGGKTDEQSGEPLYHNWDNQLIGFMGDIATRSKAVTAILWQVPRQPLYGGMTEDMLLSYTLHNFQKDGDYSWPLLFPMTKSAIRAMDAIEEFCFQKGIKIRPERFVMNGISKRGWTTWLTAACDDKRVVAIAPMVIDILNMPISVPYQKHMYGNYSIHIQDYVNLGLTEQLSTTSGGELIKMIDPYSYRTKYNNIPKMLFFGTNDEFWCVDAVKNYIDGIPGITHTSYVTNAGHNLGDKTAAFNTLEAFFQQTINGKKYPKFEYSARELSDNIAIDIKADKRLLTEVIVWEATSENKDFRKSQFKPFKIDGVAGKKRFSINISYPTKGYKAFIVMLKYMNPTSKQDTYNISTRMYTANEKELFEESFGVKITVLGAKKANICVKN